ncbi:iron chaperone [Arthrobacter pityocampae]|uniref:iron chaperone n=1 Tax=Arthrobacter pityocampae TaxID=547334 RepID=UPI00373575D3
MGSVDDALAAVEEPDQRCLRAVIATAREARPDAVDGVSYGMPALLLGGKPLLAVAATARHLSLYPFSSTVIESVVPRLEGFSRSRGTIRFTADHPLPEELVLEIVRLRSREIEGS